MKLIDRIELSSQGDERFVGLYVGDLTAIPGHEAVDLLVVSAFPNDYFPTTESLVGALARRGISVASLAARKAVDLRSFSSCWLSEEVAQPHAGFKRILCFEPLVRGAAPQVVGDVFRSLVPFASGTPPISSVAMPLLAAGDQGNSPLVMLDSMVDAALHWMTIGLDLRCIKIVIRESANSAALARTFAYVKERFVTACGDRIQPKRYRFDAFVSYSRKDHEAVDFFVSEISRSQPALRIFIDRLELQAGAAWQQHIFEALDDCRKVVPFFSPSYIGSKVCKEEFNIALMRHRDSEEGVLFPLYLHSAELPTYMRLVQSVDVREGDSDKLRKAAGTILKCMATDKTIDTAPYGSQLIEANRQPRATILHNVTPHAEPPASDYHPPSIAATPESQAMDSKGEDLGGGAQDEATRQLSILQIEDRIRERVLGQEIAIGQIMPWIAQWRFGLWRSKGPAAVFLFLGPTGTGKTQLAKEIARNVFGDEEQLLVMEMGEFQSKESMNMFVGARPGHVGYGKGKLTNGLRDKPECVVLFQRIEKAAIQILDQLLCFVDEGVISDPAGPVRDGRKCIIVLTTNAGEDWLRDRLSNHPDARSDPTLAEQLLKAGMKELLERGFRPEFLARVSERVIFLPHTLEA